MTAVEGRWTPCCQSWVHSSCERSCDVMSASRRLVTWGVLRYTSDLLTCMEGIFSLYSILCTCKTHFCDCCGLDWRFTMTELLAQSWKQLFVWWCLCGGVCGGSYSHLGCQYCVWGKGWHICCESWHVSLSTGKARGCELSYLTPNMLAGDWYWAR